MNINLKGNIYHQYISVGMLLKLIDLKSQGSPCHIVWRILLSTDFASDFQ